MREFLLTTMGGHTLVARNAVMALLDAGAGMDARFWFATVLLTHVLSVALLARLIWLLTGNAALAGLGAFAWGSCPLASETLGWYAVYGQVAATTCLLVAFGRVAACRRSGSPLSTSDLIFVTGWLVLSGLFFGSVIGATLVWPVAAALLVPAGERRGDRWRLVAVSAAVLTSYALLQVVGARTYDAQPVPVQLLVWLGRRWWPAVVAMAQLTRVGVSSLLLGAWWAPGERSDVLSWLTLGVATVTWTAFVSRKPGPLRRAALAFGLLALASYALIAAARGPLAGPLWQMTLARVAATPRYHYAPQAFLAVAVCAALQGLAPLRRQFVGLVWAGVLVAGQLRHGVRVDRHDAARAEVAQELAALEAAIAATPTGSTVTVPNRPIHDLGLLPNTMDSPPGLAGLFIIAVPSDTVDGRVVRFVDPNAAVRAAARRRGGRTAALLVPPPGP